MRRLSRLTFRVFVGVELLLAFSILRDVANVTTTRSVLACPHRRGRRRMPPSDSTSRRRESCRRLRSATTSGLPSASRIPGRRRCTSICGRPVRRRMRSAGATAAPTGARARRVVDHDPRLRHDSRRPRRTGTGWRRTVDLGRSASRQFAARHASRCWRSSSFAPIGDPDCAPAGAVPRRRVRHRVLRSRSPRSKSACARSATAHRRRSWPSVTIWARCGRIRAGSSRLGTAAAFARRSTT